MLLLKRKKRVITWTPLPERLKIKETCPKKRKSGILSLLTIFLFIVVIILLAIIYFSTVYVNMTHQKGAVTKAKTQTAFASELVAPKKLQKVVVEENCYGLTAPFNFRKISRVDVCSVFILLDSPNGVLVVD